MLRNNTVLELCDPEPFTVATWILMSLTTRFCPSWPDDPRGATSVVAITLPFWSETLLSRANSVARGVLRGVKTLQYTNIIRAGPVGVVGSGLF